MKSKRGVGILAVVLTGGLLAGCGQQRVHQDASLEAQGVNQTIGVNVLLRGPITDAALRELGRLGRVRDTLPSLNALTMQTTSAQLAAIRALPVVLAANPDAERGLGPVQATLAEDSFAAGISTWNLDAIDVTDYRKGRTLAETGRGVYVAVLDTGFVNNWTSYFPAARVATEYARSFGGGGGEVGNVSEQPNKWGQDQNSHGTHVASTILGFAVGSTPVNGVAPEATIIPVKVLNQNGSGWSSVISRGITYIADLKAGELKDHPVVINMSLGGSRLDAVEKAAIDYAIARGVIIVASGGNSGERGMGYPGGYAPVISVAAAGWDRLFDTASNPVTWRGDTRDPFDASEYHVADFSSRDLYPGDERTQLDVTAPGEGIVGPYQTNGQLSYYYLSGTSMAAPHIAGVAALMAQKNPALTQAQAEASLKAAAALTPLIKAQTEPKKDVVPATAREQGSGFVLAPNALAQTP